MEKKFKVYLARKKDISDNGVNGTSLNQTMPFYKLEL